MKLYPKNGGHIVPIKTILFELFQAVVLGKVLSADTCTLSSFYTVQNDPSVTRYFNMNKFLKRQKSLTFGRNLHSAC